MQNVIVDKRIKLDNLLVGDKNAITISSRITGYGADYTAKVTCPACMTVQDYSFNLGELKANFPTEEELEEFNVEITPQNTFLMTLPITGVVVEARLITGRDEKTLSQTAKMKSKHKMNDSAITDQMKLIIVSANGDKDKNNISKFVDNMPAADSRYFRLCYAGMTPNIDTKQEFECDSCGYEQDLEVPLSAEFFWPRQ